MNTTTTDAGRAVREATEQFLVDEAPALADELTEALLSVAAQIAGFRKHLPANGHLVESLRPVDDAFARSVALARRLSVVLRADRDPGAYADVARIARDLARRVAPAMPEGTAMTVECPDSPALATMPSPEVRRVLSVLMRCVVDGLTERRGNVSLAVTEVRHGTRPGDVHVLIGHRALRPSAAADAADEVRANVNANGGSVDPCARHGGGAAVVLRLPSAC